MIDTNTFHIIYIIYTFTLYMKQITGLYICI